MIGKSKVLDTNIEWYDEIDGTSFYETHFQDIFLAKLDRVYPDFIGVKFSLNIKNSYGESSDPDLAMVRKDYKEWYVIEVEMGRHGWEDHVEKQVRVFTSGIYDAEKTARYINGKNKKLVIKKLEQLIRNVPPRVLIVVNEEKSDWVKKIRKYNALISVFQIYRGTNGLEIFRVGGDIPFIYRDKSHCRFLKGSSNILEINSPEFIKERNGDELKIVFRGVTTKWVKKQSKNRTYLITKGYNKLQLEKNYVLYITNLGEYYIEFN